MRMEACQSACDVRISAAKTTAGNRCFLLTVVRRRREEDDVGACVIAAAQAEVASTARDASFYCHPVTDLEFRHGWPDFDDLA